MSTKQVTSTVGKGMYFPKTYLPFKVFLELSNILAAAFIPK